MKFNSGVREIIDISNISNIHITLFLIVTRLFPENLDPNVI